MTRRMPAACLALTFFMVGSLFMHGPVAGGQASSPSWTLEDDSRLGFKTAQGGAPVEGLFGRFEAEIEFSAENLEASRVAVVVDIASVKELIIGLVSFHPTIPKGIGVIFYIHLFLLSVLIAYFPFSKLMHAGGVFFSPTRNMPNDNRARRHINPWNYPVKVHTYDEYEDDFREKMKEVGLPVEKE